MDFLVRHPSHKNRAQCISLTEIRVPLPNTHNPIRLALRPSEIIQYGSAVELIICGLNLLGAVHNEDGDPLDRQWRQVNLVVPSDNIAGVIDIERCHTGKRWFRDLLVDELLSGSDGDRPELVREER